MDLRLNRPTQLDNSRAEDIIRLIPNSKFVSALDVGAQDGHFSRILAEKCEIVVALDLEKPTIDIQDIKCVKGDVTHLQYEDDCFDLVFCTEVLEHIPKHLTERACAELSRVSKNYLLIGVPYKQDVRVGRTTCASCGKKNPPWGHVNTFDEKRIKNLFDRFNIEKISFVGETTNATNSISTFLLDLAGNPYGIYNQEEPCIHCGNVLQKPTGRNIIQRLLSRCAYSICKMQKPFIKPHPIWMHILFKKKIFSDITLD